ncbi:MAG: hypothetical protein QOI55_1724, partial [Actinomycetota bacterium]|nr:hypothetical protein [Actinomycetota bacterium]
TRVLGQRLLGRPEQRVGLTLVVPVAVILLLWTLALKSWQRYEMFPADGPKQPRPESETTPFDDPAFWDGKERAQTLRNVHVGGSLAFLSALVAYVGIAAHRDGDSGALPTLLFVVSLVVLAIAIGLVLTPPSASTNTRSTVLLRSAGALLIATGLLVPLTVRLRQPSGPLPGTAPVLTTLLAAELAVIAVLLIGQIRQVRASRAAKTGLLGCGSGCTTVVALVIAGAFCAGAIVRAADFLGVPTVAANTHQAQGAIVIPAAVTWSAAGAAVALIAIGLWLVAAIPFAVWLHAHRQRGEIQTEWNGALAARGSRADWAEFRPAENAAREDRRELRRRQIAKAVARGKLTDHAGLVLGPAALIAFVVAVIMVVPTVLADQGNAHWAEAPGSVVRYLRNAGSWLIVAFAVALFTVMYRSYRNSSLRRQVGILWDLATFWPRSAHPLAPPCYAERAIPEFAARTTFFRTGDPDYAAESSPCCDVIVSAHSQGTVIAAAMLLRLGDLDGIALLTYGSPLRRLYTRYFPSYFDEHTLRQLESRLDGRWRNLYRPTDPIGAAVAAGTDVDVEVDIPLLRQLGDTTFPPIEAHSRYQREQRYRTAIRQLAEMFEPRDPRRP